MRASRWFLGLTLLLTSCGGGGGVPTPPSNDASLVALELSAGSLAPAFAPGTTLYTAAVGAILPSLTVTPTAAQAGATILVNGQAVGSGQPSPAIALAGGFVPVTVEVRAPDGVTTRAYALAVTRAAAVAQEAYAKASNTEIGDQFGFSVALSGDTLAVGAWREASNATGVNGNQSANSADAAGAVYVFTRTGGVWTQQAYLKASNSGGGDCFGHAVALSGDTLAVGAWAEDSNATGVNGNQADDSAPESGAVYVFTRTGGVWTQQAYLKASNTNADDRFGQEVALAGDTLAVGVWREASNATGVNGNQADDSAPESGAVYVFSRTAGLWTQQAYLKASNTGAGDFFGSAVALSGDTLAVGAWGEDSNATGVNGNQADDSAPESGAVYVFSRTGGAWAQQAYLKASNTDSGDRFGSSLDRSGDTLVVGAPGEGSNATGVNGNQSANLAGGSGAVYVFTHTGGVWMQQAYLKASNSGADDMFGIAVALSGDALVVGAWREASNATGVNGNQADDSAPESGAAYVFTRTGGVWMQQAYLKASNTGARDLFGQSVALSGDTLVVGAPDEDGRAGAAYIFR